MSRHDRFRRPAARHRRLHVESLEDRRMLAVATVDTELDVVDISDGVTSLREAIFAANVVGGADTIDFDAALDGGTILLALGELAITDALTIDATSLVGGLTIDAQQNSRIANITATTGDFTFAGLTLTGGETVARDEDGGAIRSYTTGSLVVEQSTITGNRTLDAASDNAAANGGGIHAIGDVTISSSTISGNCTYGSGGGVIASLGNVTLTNSTVSNNSASGSIGGIGAFGNVTLLNSAVSGNIASGGSGGGINTLGDVTLTNSTVSGNSATGGGGGIVALGDVVTLINSTVSGNSTSGQQSGGGGIFIIGNATLTNSTVIGNSDSSTGFFRGGIVATAGITTLINSIVAGNTSSGSNLDLIPAGALQVNYSLIGDTSGLSAARLADINAGIGNLFDLDPLLGPLADNGGPTQTHALLPGSPALDAGNSALTVDQRGLTVPIDLIEVDNSPEENGSDIGAYEAQIAPSADFVDNDFIDGGDFLAWQRGFGTNIGAVRADGNSDDDGDVDASDLAAWTATFGQVELTALGGELSAFSSQLSASESQQVVSSSSVVDLIDTALALEWLRAGTNEREPALDAHPTSAEARTDTAIITTDDIRPAVSLPAEPDAARSRDVDKAADPWMSDELLERVFG